MADIKKRCPGCGQYFKGPPRKKYCVYICSMDVVVANAEQLKIKKGKYYERWKKGVLEYMGRK